MWSRLARLTPERVRLLAEAWRALARARVQVARTRSLRFPEPRAVVAPAADLTHVAAIVVDSAWAVSRAARAVPGASCLVQALAARQMLARRGVEASLRFGVRRGDAAPLAAHAWLERDGLIVFGQSDEPYVPLGHGT